MGSTLIEAGFVLKGDVKNTVLRPGFVMIEGDRITKVGEGPAPRNLAEDVDRQIQAPQMAVLPGLINAHVHLFQSFVRGLADDRPLLSWLEENVWPIFEHMTAEDVYLASMLSIVENIRGGATAVEDNQYGHVDPASDDAVLRAAEQSGIRYVMARGWADVNYHYALMESPDRIMGEVDRLYKAWHGTSNGRIRIGLGPLIPWGCSRETLTRSLDYALERGLTAQMHVAETKAEVEMSLASHGRRHVEWLDEIGLLTASIQLVHSVWLDEQEIVRVAEAGASVVHCPASNMFLASGVAPVARMRQHGIPVALGTDGQACNCGHEMIDILKLTANLQKVAALDATILPRQEILAMACRGGATALGQPDLVGVLAPGMKADLIIVDLSSSRLLPDGDVGSLLVNWARSEDVDTVIVDGEILMRHGRITFVDEADLVEQARQARGALWRRAGVDVQ